MGFEDADLILGLMLEYGMGIPESHEDAASHYLKAAMKGKALACREMGSLYSKGKGVPQSPSESIRWYREGAETGDMDS